MTFPSGRRHPRLELASEVVFALATTVRTATFTTDMALQPLVFLR